MLTETTAVERLRNRPFCLFLGSGISRQAGLPMGKELGTMILEALGLSEKEANDLAEKYHLERMLFLLKGVLGESVHAAYLALSSSLVGGNHIAVANLSKEKNIPILTTNQDELIELASEGHLPAENLVKIHGTMSDINSLRVTLDRVSDLSPDMYDRLSAIAKYRVIVVVGYSFSDYDLRDFFLAHRDHLLYCRHSKDNVFLRDVVWEGNRQAYDDHCFVSTAEQFFPHLLENFGLFIPCVTYTAAADVEKSIRNRLSSWANSYPKYLCKLAVGSLPQGLWKGSDSSEILESVANDAEVPPFYRVVALAEAANAAHSQDDHAHERILLSCIKTIGGLDKRLGKFFYSLYMGAHYHIGNNSFSWLWAWNMYLRARRLLPAAVLTTKEGAVERLFVKNCRKNIDHGIASSLVKLNRQIPVPKALEEARLLIEPYYQKTIPCDLDFFCEVLFIRGKLRLAEKDITGAEGDYRKALDIAKWIRKDHSIDQAYRGLGRIVAIKGDFGKAAGLLQESYEVAKKLDQPSLLARNHLTLAWLYAIMGDNKKARENRDAGRTIYQQKIGRIRGAIDSYLYLRDRYFAPTGDTGSATDMGKSRR